MDNNSFDLMAATWDENPVRLNMTRAVARKIMDRLDLTTDMNALEIGSGTGLVTVQLAPMLGQVTALDSSEKMLEELRKKAETMGIHNITARNIDLEKDAIPGKNYHLIFSNMTFHHILDGNSLLKKIHDALAPGGVLVLSDLDMEDGTFHGDMPKVYHLGFARGALVTALELAGFRHCSIEDAHVVEKRDDREEIRCYPMFLATGRTVCIEKCNPGGRL